MFSTIKSKSVQLFADPNAKMVLRLVILTLLTVATLLFPEAAFAEPVRGGTGS